MPHRSTAFVQQVAVRRALNSCAALLLLGGAACDGKEDDAAPLAKRAAALGPGVAGRLTAGTWLHGADP